MEHVGLELKTFRVPRLSRIKYNVFLKEKVVIVCFAFRKVYVFDVIDRLES